MVQKGQNRLMWIHPAELTCPARFLIESVLPVFWFGLSCLFPDLVCSAGFLIEPVCLVTYLSAFRSDPYCVLCTNNKPDRHV